MEIETIVIFTAIIMIVGFGILIGVILNLKKRHDQDIRHKEDEIQDLDKKLGLRQSRSFQAGVNVTAGDYSEILGDFALLSKYDSLITLSTTSRQASLDLIGVNADSIDFLELKKKGAGSSEKEKQFKKLIDEKKVSYKIFDVDLPDNFTIEERKKKELKKATKTKEPPKKLTREERHDKKELQKIEAKKEHATAYEPWTTSDDELLIKYWGDESNEKTSGEKILELCGKLDRSEGGVRSRIKKLGLRE